MNQATSANPLRAAPTGALRLQMAAQRLRQAEADRSPAVTATARAELPRAIAAWAQDEIAEAEALLRRHALAAAAAAVRIQALQHLVARSRPARRRKGRPVHARGTSDGMAWRLEVTRRPTPAAMVAALAGEIAVLTGAAAAPDRAPGCGTVVRLRPAAVGAPAPTHAGQPGTY